LGTGHDRIGTYGLQWVFRPNLARSGPGAEVDSEPAQ
jgi:hypothetical protein